MTFSQLGNWSRVMFAGPHCGSSLSAVFIRLLMSWHCGITVYDMLEYLLAIVFHEKVEV